ncbi:MAG TPA: type II toxin-antitoxin system HicA family toxin [Phycisphaerae bacterium]
MSYNRRKVLRALSRRGVVLLREGREHTVMISEAGRQSTLPRHRDLDGRTVRAIVKQLGLDWREIEKDLT